MNGFEKEVSSMNKRFDKWTIIKKAPNRKSHKYYLCKCECGTEREVNKIALIRGKTKSCGCERNKARSLRMMKHGKSKHPLYKRVYQEYSRCNNPNNISYFNYGGRGIKFNFPSVPAAFDWILANLGELPSPGHEIDRKDNDEHNEPRNLRYATRSQQIKNSRLRKTKASRFFGVSQSRYKKTITWIARANNIYLGSFKTEEEAHNAVQEYLRCLC